MLSVIILSITTFDTIEASTTCTQNNGSMVRSSILTLKIITVIITTVSIFKLDIFTLSTTI